MDTELSGATDGRVVDLQPPSPINPLVGFSKILHFFWVGVSIPFRLGNVFMQLSKVFNFITPPPPFSVTLISFPL